MTTGCNNNNFNNDYITMAGIIHNLQSEDRKQATFRSVVTYIGPGRTGTFLVFIHKYLVWKIYERKIASGKACRLVADDCCTWCAQGLRDHDWRNAVLTHYPPLKNFLIQFSVGSVKTSIYIYNGRCWSVAQRAGLHLLISYILTCCFDSLKPPPRNNRRMRYDSREQR